MNNFDYIVVAAYLGFTLFLGFFLRDQKSEGDFFLGGRSMGWMPLSLSAMATQLSAISFISAPAFVGLRENGGLKWLTYEFALPLAMLLVMFVITPALYRSGYISIYEYLEKRFSRSTRVFISVAFQIARCFATGIMVYATGLVLESVLGIPFWLSISLIGFITLIYSAFGGMKAVVYTDAIQMCLVAGGLLVCLVFALEEIGGFSQMMAQVEPARLNAVDFTSFGFSGDEFGFFPMLLGGFVLYASYYGCDQTQAQRALSAKNMGDVRKMLLANGLLRFPIVMLTCFTGLAVGVVALNNPEFLATIPKDKPDYLMPRYILEFLPHGVIGLLLVAVMSAAMSTLSSTINSLAAVSMEDMAMLGWETKTQKSAVIRSRLLATIWGVVILLLSAFAGDIAPTVLEAINKVGSAMYGPVVAVFLMGMLSKNIGSTSANIGLVVGLGVNLLLWKFAPEIFWIWWNFIGLTVTLTVAYLVQIFAKNAAAEVEYGKAAKITENVDPKPYIIGLSLYFVVIVVIATSIKSIWG